MARGVAAKLLLFFLAWFATSKLTTKKQALRSSSSIFEWERTRSTLS
jgi:hypothetical protein